jgi:hypothetical protein
MKVLPVETEFFRADRQTDMKKLLVAFEILRTRIVKLVLRLCIECDLELGIYIHGLSLALSESGAISRFDSICNFYLWCVLPCCTRRRPEFRYTTDGILTEIFIVVIQLWLTWLWGQSFSAPVATCLYGTTLRRQLTQRAAHYKRCRNWTSALNVTVTTGVTSRHVNSSNAAWCERIGVVLMLVCPLEYSAMCTGKCM